VALIPLDLDGQPMQLLSGSTAHPAKHQRLSRALCGFSPPYVPFLSMQVELHLPRNPLRQTAFGEAGLEVRLVREHVAGIVEDRVHLNLGMSDKPSLDLFASRVPRQVSALPMSLDA
jgi:hypothetical protein